MLKGYQRKLIMMPTHDSSLFETAYFVLRDEAENRRPEPSHREMLCEATRILEASAADKKDNCYGKKHLLLALAFGFLVGICLALWIALRSVL